TGHDFWDTLGDIAEVAVGAIAIAAISIATFGVGTAVMGGFGLTAAIIAGAVAIDSANSGENFFDNLVTTVQDIGRAVLLGVAGAILAAVFVTVGPLGGMLIGALVGGFYSKDGKWDGDAALD